MSTKTTIKRIALVAVSALGLGVLTSVSGNAAVGGTGTSTNYTSGITLSTSSVTVVDATNNGTTGGVRFYVDTTNLNGTTSTADGLQTGETITVSVASASSATAAVSDLKVHVMSASLSGTTVTYTSASNADTTGSVTSSDTASPNYSWSATGTKNNEVNRYWFGLVPKSGKAMDNGTYTIRVRLTNANGSVIDKTLTAKWVSTIADAGAVLTLANSGTIKTGSSYAYTSNGYTKATLTDANGGRVLLGLATIAGATDASTTPALNAALVSSAGTVLESYSADDTGADATDYAAGTGTDPSSSTCGVGGAAACVTLANSEILANRANGVYGITGTVAATASTTNAIRVRVTNTSVSKTVAVVIAAGTSATAVGTAVTATAAGLKSSDTLAKSPTAGCTTACEITYNVPLTTKDVSLSIDTNGAAGDAITSTVGWSGNYASANVTPADATETVNYLDSNGKFSVALSNKDAVNGASASVTVTGFTTATHKLTITVNWVKPAISTLTVADPIAGVYAKTKATTVFTLVAKDQFGNTLAGEQVIPSLGSTSPNYSATTTYAAITTGANGTVTFSLTDAAAVADDVDALTFTSVSDATVYASYSLTYKATLPAVGTMYGYTSDTFANATASTVATAIPSTGLLGGAGVTLVLARDLSKSLAANTDSTANDMYSLRIRSLTAAGVAAAGASVTLTAPTGGWVLDASGLPASTRTVAIDSSGDAYFQILATSTGNLKFTATSGTASYSFTLVVADQSNDAARFVTITSAKTGASNGAGVPVTVAVTDRYGNGVANVTLTVTASGVGAFMGGATSQSYTTDASGKYTFLATSYDAAGGDATYSVNATNATDAAGVAGYTATGSAIDSTVKAGNKAATATITFDSGTNPASDALDAANEATDAANAATDAANAAAEAADAATAAAQDAQAAVAELATKVASLIAGIKAQITTLTNLVIKIQKKVRA